MKYKKLTIALIIILALVIAAVACWFLFCKSTPEKEESTDSVVTTEASETEAGDSEIITDAQEEETTADTVRADTEDNAAIASSSFFVLP